MNSAVPVAWPRSRARQSGFVLLVVLWTVALLALLGGHIIGAARMATARAAGLRAGAVAGATADGLVFEAIFHVLDPSAQRWAVDGVPRRIKLSRGTGTVTVTNEAGRINPSFAPPALLAALLRAVGQPAARATSLAAAITEWHTAGRDRSAAYAAARLPYGPPGEAFLDLDELLLIPGLTPELLSRLSPYLSVHGNGHWDPALADPLIAPLVQALDASQRPQQSDKGGPLVMRITATAQLPDGAATRQAVIRIDPAEDDPAEAVDILAWQ